MQFISTFSDFFKVDAAFKSPIDLTSVPNRDFILH